MADAKYFATTKKGMPTTNLLRKGPHLVFKTNTTRFLFFFFALID
jgi:hypothetical protein